MIALYFRTSSARQADQNDTAGQEHAMSLWMKGRGLDESQVVRFTDSGFTGRNMKRPAFDSMCEQISAGKIKSVCAASLSRFARNVRGLLDFVDLCRKHSVQVVSLKESIDTESPAGRLFLTIMAALFAFESELSAERIRDGMQAGIARGAVYGRAPKLTPEQVEQGRAMLAGGALYQTVAKALQINRNTVRSVFGAHHRRKGKAPAASVAVAAPTV